MRYHVLELPEDRANCETVINTYAESGLELIQVYTVPTIQLFSVKVLGVFKENAQ